MAVTGYKEASHNIAAPITGHYMTAARAQRHKCRTNLSAVFGSSVETQVHHSASRAATQRAGLQHREQRHSCNVQQAMTAQHRQLLEHC